MRQATREFRKKSTGVTYAHRKLAEVTASIMAGFD